MWTTLRGTVQYLGAQLLDQLVDPVDLLALLYVEGEVMKTDFVDFERMAGARALLRRY